MGIEENSLQDIKRGYTYDEENRCYACLSCGAVYEIGEIYTVDGRMFEAARAIDQHMEREHGDYVTKLIEGDSKYNSLTEHQRLLCRSFDAGESDKEIAKSLGVAASTVRHQRFTFREKAKQARMYLAMYERVFEGRSAGNHGIIPIHAGAKMVDERYVVTEAEREHILSVYLDDSAPPKLKMFPPKEKRKIVVLAKIAECFEPYRNYTEKEVNAILTPVYEDYATLRRYLVDYGFMSRSKDGTQYRLQK